MHVRHTKIHKILITLLRDESVVRNKRGVKVKMEKGQGQGQSKSKIKCLIETRSLGYE